MIRSTIGTVPSASPGVSTDPAEDAGTRNTYVPDDATEAGFPPSTIGKAAAAEAVVATVRDLTEAFENATNTGSSDVAFDFAVRVGSTGAVRVSFEWGYPLADVLEQARVDAESLKAKALFIGSVISQALGVPVSVPSYAEPYADAPTNAPAAAPATTPDAAPTTGTSTNPA